MGRPKGSRNRPRGEGNGDDIPMRINTVSGDELSDYIKRIEYCNEQQKEISSDRQQVFKELKQAGYDRDTVRAIVARRKLTVEQREASDMLMSEYCSALGEFSNTPLGQAGAERLRGETHP